MSEFKFDFLQVVMHKVVPGQFLVVGQVKEASGARSYLCRTPTGGQVVWGEDELYIEAAAAPKEVINPPAPSTVPDAGQQG